MIRSSNASSHAPRPRVLHVVTHLSLGGAERIALDLSRGLAAEFECGVFAVCGIRDDAVGLAMQRELLELQTPLFTGSRVPLKWGGLMLAAARAAKIVRAYTPAFVHLHTEIPEAAWAIVLGMSPTSSRRISRARTIHNSYYWHAWPRFGTWCERSLTPCHVIGVSQDALTAYGHLSRRAGTQPLSTEIIFNGVRPSTTRSPRNRFPNTPLKLLFAGRLELQKGADLLPAIVAASPPPTKHGCELTIIGQGACAPSLLALAGHPPHGWKVEIKPPEPNLASRLGDYDLILMPSRFEGLPLLAIEALIQSIPVVATTAPGAREAFPPDYPWLAQPSDAESFAQTMSGAFRTQASWASVTGPASDWARARFDPQRMLSAYGDCYRRILRSATG